MEGLYDEDDDTEVLRRNRNSVQKALRKLRKGLIAAFSSHSKQSNAYRTHLFLSLCLAAVSSLQGMSLVLARSDTIAEYGDMGKAFALVNYVRIDALAVDLGVEYELFYILLAVIYAPVGILAVNVGAYLYGKKRPNWLLVKSMNLLLALLEQVLLLPALILMLSFVKYTYLSNSSTMFEYGDSPHLHQSEGLAIISLITTPLLVGLLYLNSYFFYDNMFAKRRRLVYAMRDSYTHRIHIIARVGMALCYLGLSEFSRIWYRLGVLLLSGLMFFLYSIRLPYFNTTVNVGYSCRKALITWSIAAYFIGWAIDSATTIVILLIFVSPMIILLTYYHIVETLRVRGRTRAEEIVADYQVELKLRTMLEAWEAKESPEAICTAIEQLFDFATRNFPKSPLLPIWEALYYHYYKRDVALALLKLSKLHTTDITMESQFFANKLETKLSAIEVSPERLYFRYLKLLSEAKRIDESCCLQLVATCSELLGRKVDAGKFEALVKQLSGEISKTLEKYFRLLKLYPDNEETLQLIGSFMCEIVKEAEGKNFLMRSRMAKSSEVRRVSNSSWFSDANGLVVLSCCLENQGEIILANQKVYEMFKYSKIDLHKKPIFHFIPEEYRLIYLQTMNSVVLFGRWLDSFTRLFTFLLDFDGYLMPATVTAKLTTWDNKPYLVLAITKLVDTDWVLVDRDWKVSAHSCLGLEMSKHVMYRGCDIEEVLPGISEYRNKRGKAFHYDLPGSLPAIVTIAEVVFRDILFRLISLRRLSASQDHSPFNSEHSVMQQSDYKEAVKGVKFNPENTHPPAAHLIPESIPVFDSSATMMNSEAQARVNKKMDLTASVSGSTSSSTVLELMEGVQFGRSLKRVKVLLILSFLMLVIGLVASVIFVTKILSSLESITIIQQYSERNLEIIKMSYLARSLILSDSPLYPYDQPSLLLTLESSGQVLDKYIANMKENVGSENEADSYLLQPSVPIWVKQEDKYSFRMQTLLDAMYAYTAAATRLAASSAPFSELADAYFLFRNGAGDLSTITNQTLHMRVNAESESRIKSLAVMEYLVYMCIALIVLPLVLLVAPQFYLFEQHSKAVWTGIYALPIDLVLEVRTLAMDRLQTYFNNEVFLETTTTTKAATRRTTPTKLWPGFAARVSVYLLACLVFFIVIEVAYFLPLKNIALTIPNYLFWMSLRPRCISESLLWNREESLLQDPTHTFTKYIPEGQFWSQPQTRVANATSSFTFINTILNFGSSDFSIYSIKKSQEYLDFILINTCPQIATEKCEDTAAALGLTYISKEWNQMVKATYPSSNDLFATAQYEEKVATTAIMALNFAIDFYHTDAVNTIQSISLQIITLSVVFICVVFGLYMSVHARHLGKLLNKARQALRVHKILRTK